MRIEDLLDVIGEVDDELLERSEKLRYKRKGVWMKWGSLAACACLVLVAGLWAAGLGAKKMENAESDMEACPEEKVEMNGTMDEAPEAPEAAVPEGEYIEGDAPTGEPDYGINPLQGADPAGSALCFYKYEGDGVTSFYMYDNEQENKILDLIAGLEYEELERPSEEEITYPIYGIEIGRRDGWTSEVAWSNGYWFTADGAVLKADFDLGSLETDYEWRDTYQFESVEVLPCARFICQNEEGWNAEFMTPSNALKGQEDVTMAIVEQSEMTLNVEIENHSKRRWEYGQEYAIQVLLDGVWYDVPMLPGNWGFTTELLTLPEGESVERGYNFNLFYGELPMGTYRLVVAGIAAEFEIE